MITNKGHALYHNDLGGGGGDEAEVGQQGLDNHVLLHHVERHVGVGEVGRRPHQRRSEHDGQVGHGRSHAIHLI